MTEDTTTAPVATPPTTPPVAPPVVAAPPEPTPQERLEVLAASMQANYQHNAPISPSHIKEIQSLVSLGRGDKTVVQDHHEFPGSRYHDNQSITVTAPDGTVTVVSTAEQALAYIRALPDETRNKPAWVAAERTMLNAIDSNDPRTLQEAYVSFSDAQAGDVKSSREAPTPLERLPDGRVREDRFADRRLPPAPGAVAPAPGDVPDAPPPSSPSSSSSPSPAPAS